MTTHDDQPEAADLNNEVATTARHASRTSEADSTGQTDAPAAETAPSPGQIDSPAGEAERSTGNTDPSSEESLFDETALSGFRSRWTDVQAYFVDDPRDSVAKADSLVSEVFDQLTTAFATVRSQLDEARAEGASTEDLRLALMSYRAQFRRFLSI